MTPSVDEAVWLAWLTKNRAQDSRRNARRKRAVKWVSIACLVVVAALGPEFATYGLVALLAASAGAVAAMLQAADARRYRFATAFGAVALAANPIAPLIPTCGGWRAAAIACAIPFAVSLTQGSSHCAGYLDFRRQLT